MFCREGKIDFIPSKVGSYWSSNIEIDVMALDEERRKVLIGECKYLNQPVDADVFFELKEKATKIAEISQYEKMYAIFSKSGFTNRLREVASQNTNLLLIDKENVL